MRILFITSTRVGDAILSTGLLRTLLDRHPGARVTVACGAAAAPLFAAVPNLERIIVLDKMLFSLHWIRLWALTVGRFWDVLVDVRNAPLTYLIAARRSYRVGRSREPMHRVQWLADALGLRANPPSPHLWTLEHHRETARRLIPEGPAVLAVGPTANWSAKTWRPERFVELIDRLTSPAGILPGARVAVFGREDERPPALKVINTIPEPRRIDLIGRIGLLDIFACMQRCALYVGNDSGLMHLAAASGIPTLGLFGPSPEAYYAPWGPLTAVARASVAYEKIFPEFFDHRATDTLMDSLTVDNVETAAATLWRRATEAAA